MVPVFKQAMFGEYVCNVNTLKRDRFFDIPIPASKATPYNPELSTLGSLAMQEAGYHRHCVKGQHLVGDRKLDRSASWQACQEN
jgi:hypothetical protein